MSKPVPIAIFASGKGSNFESIMQAIQKGELNAQVLALVTDRAEAGVLQRAREFGVQALAIETTPLETRTEHEKKILSALDNLGVGKPHFLVFAGYMRIISPYLIEAFKSQNGYSRIVNIHPSLLPAFPGAKAYQKAFDYGCKWAGVSVHLVSLEVDTGPLCAQEAFSIEECKSVEEVQGRGQEIEHRLYPKTLNWVLNEEFKMVSRQGRNCVIRTER